MSIEDDIERIAKTLPDRASVRDAIAKLPGAALEWDGLIRCQNLAIGVSLPDDDTEHDQLLAWLRDLDIAAAPERALRVRGSGFEVHVTRYWICPGERLIPLDKFHGKLTAPARERFRRDMERLFDHGKMHAYIRGEAHWLVSETTGAIVLSSWELIPAKKRDEYFEAIDRTLAKHS